MKAYLPQSSENQYQYIYHFLPHKVYKTRARLLTHGALIAYSFVMVAAVLIFRLVPLVAPGVLGYASNINVSDLLKYTNEQRARVGLSPLKINSTLSVAAEKKAKDMFKVGYWAHISPLGTKPWDFILGEGYDYLYAGENLAKNFSSSKDVVQAWYDSPSHRENLMNSNYEDIGFAIVNGVLDGYETTLVVQMFGKTRAPVQVASVDNFQNNIKTQPVEEPVPVSITAQTSNNSEVMPESDLYKSASDETVASNVDDNQKYIYSAPLIDVRSVSRALTISFATFLCMLLSLDMWYSKKHGILKMSGHTFAHMAFLIVVVASVLISVLPGSIL